MPPGLPGNEAEVTFDLGLLAEQLAQLGKDLTEEAAELGRMEERCVDAEAAYRLLQEQLEDTLASAYLRASGTNAEARKAEARLVAADQRVAAEVAWKAWNILRAKVRTQQASLQVLHRRAEIGRSLLSREKVLISLGE
jgi:hypothetical protein